MSVKTNSAVLAQGLCWMYHWLDQPASVYVEQREGRAYYQLNLASAVRVGAKGAHLRKDPAEVRRIAEPVARLGVRLRPGDRERPLLCRRRAGHRPQLRRAAGWSS